MKLFGLVMKRFRRLGLIGVIVIGVPAIAGTLPLTQAWVVVLTTSLP